MTPHPDRQGGRVIGVSIHHFGPGFIESRQTHKMQPLSGWNHSGHNGNGLYPRLQQLIQMPRSYGHRLGTIKHGSNIKSGDGCYIGYCRDNVLDVICHNSRLFIGV